MADDDIMTIDDVAELFGVDRRTISRWRKLPRRPLPAHRVTSGRRVYFIRSEIMDWLRSHRDTPSLSSPHGIQAV